MKRVLSFLLAAVLLLGCFASAAGFVSDADAVNAVCRSVMKLEIKDGDGAVLGTASGFIAFDGSTLVTACHVIEGAHSVTACRNTGEMYEITRLLFADSAKDIAVLCFDESTGIEPLPLSDGSVLRGSPVVAIFSPQGFSNNVSKGNVSGVYTEEDVKYIRFNAPISAGSSGGALIGDDGLVIGITVGSYKGGQNQNAAVNVAELIDLYNAHKGAPVTALSERASDAHADEVPAARSFTIQNDAPFSISEVYLYADNAVSWGKARNTSGWLYKGESMEFTVSDEEAGMYALWTLNFCFYLNGKPYYVEHEGLYLPSLLGHTISVTMENYYVNIDIID